MDKKVFITMNTLDIYDKFQKKKNRRNKENVEQQSQVHKIYIFIYLCIIDVYNPCNILIDIDKWCIYF